MRILIATLSILLSSTCLHGQANEEDTKTEENRIIEQAMRTALDSESTVLDRRRAVLLIYKDSSPHSVKFLIDNIALEIDDGVYDRRDQELMVPFCFFYLKRMDKEIVIPHLIDFLKKRRNRTDLRFVASLLCSWAGSDGGPVRPGGSVEAFVDNMTTIVDAMKDSLKEE